jgi:hypothetical protein
MIQLMHKTITTSFCILFGLTAIALSSLSENPAMAQRKNVSAKEVNGTFKTGDGSNIIKVLSLGKGGLDSPLETLRERPGYNLQVEMYVSLKQGPNGEVRGNTKTLNGIASISGDLATFTPDGMESDTCTVSMKFTKPGTLVIFKQKGSCDFPTAVMTTKGTYKKISSAEPKFAQ